jgi:uncharacterized membrane protein
MYNWLPTLNIRMIIVIALTILIADFLWLGYAARGVYESLRIALNPGVSKNALPYRIIPAILAYACMVLSLSVLSVPNVVTNKGILQRMLSALVWGGMWGIGVYGTYDMTNLAIIQAFPTSTAIIDALWGIVVGSLGAFAGSYIV